MESLLQDLRYAMRAMVRRPGFTLLAVLTFGLGIAASTAMFSVVDAVLLRPPPFPEPERLVSVYTTWPRSDEGAQRGMFSYPEFKVVREQSAGVLDGLAILSTTGVVLYDRGEPELIRVGVSSADLFARVLRPVPLMGRVFTEQDALGGPPTIILTEGFWRRHFGANPEIVGRSFQFGDDLRTVIGVLPASVVLPGYTVDAWRLDSGDENWGNHHLWAIGRLAAGMSMQQASARLTPVLKRVEADQNHEHGVQAFLQQSEETRSVSGALWLLTISALVLLLVACGNVAALLIGAAIDREQEFAVRASIGANRGRIVRQLLTESALLGLGAALVGIALAVGVTRGLVLIAPEGVPRIENAAINGTALIVAITLAIVFGFACGLIPALNFSRPDLRSSMTNVTRGSTGDRGRVQAAVVVAEVTAATVMLVGAGLLARTVLALNRVDTGYSVTEVAALQVGLPISRLVKASDTDSVRQTRIDGLFSTLANELRSLPGVRDVAVAWPLPLTPARGNNGVWFEGAADTVTAERRFVSPNFFDVMGIRMVEGRAFTNEEDRPGVPGTVVISQGLARRVWPNQSAVGKRFFWWDRESVVVGVANDLRDEALVANTEYAFYVPRRQAGQLNGAFLVRSPGDPAALLTAMRQRVRTVNPALVVITAEPMSKLVSGQIASQRYRARLTIVFAALAALFSIMGIYGVTARSVASRRRELGIRMALGALPRGALALVVRQAVKLALIGAAAGLALSLIITRGLEAYLYGVKPTDPITLVTIALLMAGAAVIAALPSGLRAARVDPMEALRAE